MPPPPTPGRWSPPISRPATHDVVRKVMKDLAAKGEAITESDLEDKMSELMVQAIAQVKAGA